MPKQHLKRRCARMEPSAPRVGVPCLGQRRGAAPATAMSLRQAATPPPPWGCSPAATEYRQSTAVISINTDPSRCLQQLRPPQVAMFLRRWRPLFDQELGALVEEVIQKLESKAYQPPTICWDGELYQDWRHWLLSLRCWAHALGLILIQG